MTQAKAYYILHVLKYYILQAVLMGTNPAECLLSSGVIRLFCMSSPLTLLLKAQEVVKT